MTTTTATARPTFDLTVTYDDYTNLPSRFEAKTEYFDTREEAEAIVAALPKSMKAIATSTMTSDSLVRYYASVSAALSPKKDNSKNETGVKRLHTLLANADINYVAKYANSFDTLDAALAAL